jgi:hypothetical protein
MIERATSLPGGRSVNPLEARVVKHFASHKNCERCARHGKRTLAVAARLVPGRGPTSLCSHCADVMLAPTDEKSRRLAKLRAALER